MKLSKHTLKDINSAKVIVPGNDILESPEKVLQFGTGMLLRALPDYFIDKANRKGIFNGRVVIVKTTSKGDSSFFDKQDGLFTLCIRGQQNGQKVEKNIINSSISRVLHAGSEWNEILQCAHNLNLQVIISNTTEVGIKLVNDDILSQPPVSYPGKLLAFLFERFKAFNGSDNSGFVIVPTELLPDNGKKLGSIVLELAQLNGLDPKFLKWIERSNYFCNSLVDRIVTGTPEEKIKSEIENELGYTDDLLTLCEVYRLWAIEGNEHIKKILSFAEADEGMIIAPDIVLYRELKLRLLNATHTMSCGIAFLAGIRTVKDAMHDDVMAAYIETLMQEEIGPSIPFEIAYETVHTYTENVLDRFRNPHINHYWKNITLNYSGKMKLRCIPLLLNYYSKNDSVPELLALGFAAYICFMKAVNKKVSEYFGEFSGEQYLIEDEMAEKFYMIWQSSPAEKVVKEILTDTSLWGEDISILPGFLQSVTDKLNSIVTNGMRFTLENVLQKKINV